MAENVILTEKEQMLADTDDRISILKEVIKRKEDLESLFLDDRFQNVILSGYLEEEADRIFGMLTDPTHNLKRDVMENLMEKLMATRNVKQYFRVINQSGDSAAESLTEEEAYRVQVNKSESIIEAEVD